MKKLLENLILIPPSLVGFVIATTLFIGFIAGRQAQARGDARQINTNVANLPADRRGLILDDLIYRLSDRELLHFYAATEIQLGQRGFSHITNVTNYPDSVVFSFRAKKYEWIPVGTNGIKMIDEANQSAIQFRWNYWAVESNGPDGWKEFCE